MITQPMQNHTSTSIANLANSAYPEVLERIHDPEVNIAV
jgi:hypothetical protein